MSVFTKGLSFPRKILTRFRGGYTYLEVVIAIGIWAGCMRFIGIHHDFLLPLIYLAIAVGVTQLTRLIPTDNTRLGKWLGIQIRYFVRPHPLRPRRLVAGRRPPPPSQERHGGVIRVEGRRPDDDRRSRGIKPKSVPQLRGPAARRKR
ncbi:MAG TPA: hypothetical protein VGH44_06005 [Candidatus Saccharimonadia bacterium]